MASDELFSQLARGDRTAFDTIFRTYYAPLVRVAERLVGRHAVAEEIAQDVMVELWRRRETLSMEDSPRAYLFQATRHRALNHLRHERVERGGAPHIADASGSPATPETHLTEGEIQDAVDEAIRELPSRCREVFELSRLHGLKYAEIARVMGISVKTVEAQMGNALRVLRERLAPWLPESSGP